MTPLLEQARKALRDSNKELLSVLDSINNDRMPHDGDEFHERLSANVVAIKALEAEQVELAEVSDGEIYARVSKLAQQVANPQKVTVPAWISVIERMPERVDVLVYSPDLRNPCGQLVGRFMNGGWHCAGYEMVNTTHWMPLPQPPQGAKT